jgi:hypothetical protein
MTLPIPAAFPNAYPNACPRCGAPKYRLAPACHLCLLADNRKATDALKETLAVPHPTWCKSRQGKPCTCYQARVREALKELWEL